MPKIFLVSFLALSLASPFYLHASAAQTPQQPTNSAHSPQRRLSVASESASSAAASAVAATALVSSAKSTSASRPPTPHPNSSKQGKASSSNKQNESLQQEINSDAAQMLVEGAADLVETIPVVGKLAEKLADSEEGKQTEKKIETAIATDLTQAENAMVQKVGPLGLAAIAELEKEAQLKGDGKEDTCCQILPCSIL